MKLKSIMPALCFFMIGIAQNQTKESVQNNEVAIAWNLIAVETANAHDQFFSFIGSRALAMAHVAMHDALNAIVPKYEHYAFTGHEPGAHPIAATAQAAHDVLAAIYPAKQTVLDAELQKWLSKVSDEQNKNLGIKVGKQAAAAILARRQNDGHDAKGEYKPGTNPGDYQYTPNFDWVLAPDFRYAKPFALSSPDQFRASPPPKLNSAEYAEAYNEVMNIFDTYLATFDSKYHYNTWRPYTAIRMGDKDGNPDTAPDPSWEPEMLTPPFPEYPSGHSAVGASGAEILTHVYGTPNVTFSMESVTALPNAKVRSYDNLNRAADDCADSRVMNGFHFRFATEAGKFLGRRVARHLISNYLRPIEASSN